MTIGYLHDPTIPVSVLSALRPEIISTVQDTAKKLKERDPDALKAMLECLRLSRRIADTTNFEHIAYVFLEDESSGVATQVDQDSDRTEKKFGLGMAALKALDPSKNQELSTSNEDAYKKQAKIFQQLFSQCTSYPFYANLTSVSSSCERFHRQAGGDQTAYQELLIGQSNSIKQSYKQSYEAWEARMISGRGEAETSTDLEGVD